MTRFFDSFRPILVLALFAVALAACGSSQSSASVAQAPKVAKPGTFQAQIASSDIAVGRNRFTFGIIDNNHPLVGGTPSVRFFYLKGNTVTPEGSTTARFNYFARGLKDTDVNTQAVDLKGVYVAYPTFQQAGSWGAEIRLSYHGRMRVMRTGFTVRRHDLTPAVGSAAPRSNNPTIAEEPATKLDSGRPPDDMHRLSIRQAIAQHRPLVVLFSTPAFCESRLCGPVTQIVEQVEKQYRGRVNFVHIEIYKDANPQHGYAPTVLQWHLPSEPWVFVINRHGIITAKFDGPTAGSEIVAAIQSTLHS